jgi:hypothetical protein
MSDLLADRPLSPQAIRRAIQTMVWIHVAAVCVCAPRTVMGQIPDAKQEGTRSRPTILKCRVHRGARIGPRPRSSLLAARRLRDTRRGRALPVSPFRRGSTRGSVARASPFFFKQWGGIHKSKTGRQLDGRTYDEQPAVGPVAAMRTLAERKEMAKGFEAEPFVLRAEGD